MRIPSRRPKRLAILFCVVVVTAAATPTEDTTVIDTLYARCPNAAEVRSTDRDYSAALQVFAKNLYVIAGKAANAAYACSLETTNPRVRDSALLIYDVDLWGTISNPVQFEMKGKVIQDRLSDLFAETRYAEVRELARTAYAHNQRLIDMARETTPAPTPT